jgi:transcriptional regulator with XRE-family HTH domain
MSSKPHEVDVIVGQNLKKIRKANKLSQTDLAERLCITFQQIQKYEKGTNRISSSKLVMCALHLDASIKDLYAGTGVKDGADHEISSVQVQRLTNQLNELSNVSLDAIEKMVETFLFLEIETDRKGAM